MENSDGPTWKRFREEVQEIRVRLAELPQEEDSFESLRWILQIVSENPALFDEILLVGTKEYPPHFWWPMEHFQETDPEPGETPDSNPNPIQGDLPEGRPVKQPGTPFQDEGERR